MREYGQIYQPTPVAGLEADARGTFVTKTYVHLFGAIGAFTLIEVFLFQTGLAEAIASALLGVSWLLVLGGFVVVSWLASRVTHSTRSLGQSF